MTEDPQAEIEHLKKQRRADRKLIERAAQALGEIDRGAGLSDEQADVLAALRIRIEGKERASLEDLLATTGDISGKKDLGDLMTDEPQSGDWPVVEEKKKDWPGL